jgi:isoleucyl-tRNA synthetase
MRIVVTGASGNVGTSLLGALADFDEAERVRPEDMPELERWVLHRLAELDAELRRAAEGYEFNRYSRLITAFAQDDLSAFFFDIRKDALYCDVGPALRQGTAKRRAYRTVLDHVFQALVRWTSPILCFTAEEVWQTRYPEGGSVHLLEWPEIDADWRDEALGAKWDKIMAARERVTEAIEPYRKEKAIGSSLAAEVIVPSAGPYYVASHIPQSQEVLRKNPNYSGPRPQRLGDIMSKAVMSDAGGEGAP